MNRTEAVELADYAKQMLIFTTTEQAAALRDLLLPFPDSKWARELIRRHGTEAQRLSLPWVKASLDDELRRRQMDSASRRKADDQRNEADIAAWWKAADTWAAALTPDEESDFTLRALLSMPEGARKVCSGEGKTVKTSRILRGCAYEIHCGRPALA